MLKLLYNADFENALEPLDNLSTDEIPEINLLRARILELKGDYPSSLQQVNTILDQEIDEMKTCLYCACIQRSYVHYRLRQTEDVEYYLNYAQKVKDNADSSSELFKYFCSISHNLQGNISLNRGNLKGAMAEYTESIRIKEEIGDNFGISNIYNNMGEVYRTRGDFIQAETYLNQSIDNSSDLVNQSFVAIPMLNLGLLHSQLGDYDLSLEYLLRTYNMTNYLRYPVLLAYILYQLVVVNIRMDKLAEAKGYLGDLEQLHQQYANDMISLLFDTGRAFVLKEGRRTKDKVESQAIFEKIVHDKVIDHEITVFAQMNLCQLLLEELKQYGDEEVLSEIRKYILGLEEIAVSQNSPRLLAETFLLQSKLALLDLDTTRAKHLLSEAMVIAGENDYHNLFLQLSQEMDKILENERIWQDLNSNNNNLVERLDYLELDEIVNNVMYRRLKRVKDLPNEDPKLLLIIDQGGIVRYTLNIGGADKINENLVGAFLTAINSFLNDAFAVESHLEYIKYGNYKIIMKPEDKLLFCYIFEGSSYHATKTVEQIIDFFLKHQQIWTQITSSFDKLASIPPEITEELNKLIHNGSN